MIIPLCWASKPSCVVVVKELGNGKRSGMTVHGSTGSCGCLIAENPLLDWFDSDVTDSAGAVPLSDDNNP